MESGRKELHYTRREGIEMDGEWEDRITLYQEEGHIAPFLSAGLESSADTLPLGGSDTH